MEKANRMELLAPAGNLLKLKTAVAFGADAVYAGMPDFSLRARINEFDKETLAKGLEYAHARQVRLYVTVNIFAHERHLQSLAAHVVFLRELGVDGIIVSDPGVLSIVKEVWPKAELHLSTQANCLNSAAVKFWEKAGIKRIILGRELPLSDIGPIKAKVPGMVLEYFVHGAMCLSYSGRCYLSKELMGRSGNLGDCAQPCRWPYVIKTENNDRGEGEFTAESDSHGTYLFNSKDIMLIGYMDELVNAGISSFKIEGRTKSVYYIAQTVASYRHILDLIMEGAPKAALRREADFLASELAEKLSHRGYSSGFLLGDEPGETRDRASIVSSWEFCGQIMGEANKTEHGYRHKVRVHNSISIGDELEVLSPGYGIIRLKPDNLEEYRHGNVLDSVHGGQGKEIALYYGKKIKEFSIIRRKL